MSDYSHNTIEQKWQAQWAESGLYRSVVKEGAPKHYALTMLPYPSGDLHIGHWYAMTPSDARARFKRMQGYNVLFPMGFDAFGLPAENAAIKHGLHPADWTWKNIERMRGQLKSMGAMFDWEREAVSCDPSYYKWTQWFFLKMVEMGLAYRKYSAVDFCPSCNTTLAREQVWGEDRHCERCETPVVKKKLEQWYFKITDYADELLDFSQIEWPERVVTMQKNWIGRSEGAQVVFKTEQGDDMPVFTTRPDTLWGATFMVMAPEHPLVATVTTADQKAAVAEYQASVARLTNIERESAEREKTGVFTGGYAINPVNNERIPIWVADYVLMEYGFGAIMAVPAHDGRDFAFARKFGLKIIPVIAPDGVDLDGDTMEEAYIGAGTIVNSGPINGTAVTVAKGRKNPSIAAAIDWIEAAETGKESINYRMRDWLISRQRYWGCPIPIVYCNTCGTVPIPLEQLPVELPNDIAFDATGRSPLKTTPSFYETTCPVCGEAAERETDTMDTFMCSSWYQYRYLSPNDTDAPFTPEEGAYWLPVDQYTGGVEHATMHLLYTRFFSMMMRDAELVDMGEPMTRLNNQGIILAEDGFRMSKSRGNVVAPDDLVGMYGADTVRTYLMFFSRWEQGGPWSSKGIKGSRRFIEDVWKIGTVDYVSKAETADKMLIRTQHQTIEKMTREMEAFSFNTAVAAMMAFRNVLLATLRKQDVSAAVWDDAAVTLTQLLAPIAPHITEEIWAQRGHTGSVHVQAWPVFDAALAKEDEIELVVQVNGKVRDKMMVAADITEEDAKAAALASESAQRFMDGKEPRRVIVIKGRLVNIVV